jgi:Ca2+/Na+ antiporter
MSDSNITQGGQVRVLTDNALFYLKGASPWLRFIGVLGYISCGFMVAGGLIMLIAAPLLEDFSIDGTTGFLMGILYLASAVITFFPARFAYSFGARLRNYFLSNTEKELELAFKYNKSLWKFYGIAMIIVLALIPIGISLAVYASVAGYF